jgi:hypothetical protein
MLRFKVQFAYLHLLSIETFPKADFDPMISHFLHVNCDDFADSSQFFLGKVITDKQKPPT